MPVEPSVLGGFLITAGAIVVSPGPDTFLILRHTLSSGQRAGLAAVLGVQLGLIVHTVLAALGVSLIIASSPALFAAVAIIGAAYLAYIGVQGWRGGGAVALGGAAAAVTPFKALRDAVLTNLLNPKVIVLFLALFPNFIRPERGDVGIQLAALAAALIVLNTLWQAPMTWAAKAARRWLEHPRHRRWINRLTGGILILFAALMLVEHGLRW